MLEKPDIRVLLVEDDEQDYRMIQKLLARAEGARYSLDWVSGYDQAMEEVRRGEHDVYLVDYRLEARDGIELLREVNEQSPAPPVILLTARGSYTTDVEAMFAQAADYLDKQRLDPVLLDRSIRYALQHHRAQQALEKSRSELELRVAERTAELTQAKESLEQRAGELSQAHRHKDEFMAILGHELRSPLGAISNGIHLIRRRATGDPEVQGSCDRVERQLREVVRLVASLQDVARMQRGMLHVDLAPLDLVKSLEEAILTVRPLLRERDHNLTSDLPRTPLCVAADHERMVQVFTNLLENAATYTDTGGSIHVSARQEGSSAVVSVRDNGVGIDPEEAPRLFDLFTQSPCASDSSRTRLGIGLALVKGLMQVQHGSVEVHSEGRGCGSEFKVRLPVPASE